MNYRYNTSWSYFFFNLPFKINALNNNKRLLSVVVFYSSVVVCFKKRCRITTPTQKTGNSSLAIFW